MAGIVLMLEINTDYTPHDLDLKNKKKKVSTLSICH